MAPQSGREALVSRLEHRTERLLTVLAVVLIPLLLIPLLVDLTAEAAAVLVDADYVIWAIFAGALIVPLAVSPNRFGYLRRHWLDFILVAVPMLGPFRSARAIRLLWVVGAAGRVLDGSRRLIRQRSTGLLLFGATLVVVVAAGMIVSVERGEPNATIHTYPDGLWWALTTVATVGYGDKYPVTIAGRGIAVALMLVGVAAFGVVTARLAALFVEEQEDAAKSQLDRMDKRLRRIEAMLLRPPEDEAALASLRKRARKATKLKSKRSAPDARRGDRVA